VKYILSPEEIGAAALAYLKETRGVSFVRGKKGTVWFTVDGDQVSSLTIEVPDDAVKPKP
jgi:hypothetical protein